MYILASHIKNLPVLSLQNGAPVATTGEPIINRDKLELVAVYCKSGFWRQSTHVIMSRDIREIARQGLVIDSLDEIEEIGEIVRLKKIVDARFNPIGMNVVTEAGDALGKVEDYTLNVKGFHIQKLYVKQSILKNLLLNNLVIDRTQIVEIADKKFVVRDAKLPKAKLAPSPIPEV
jgi:uncharacterized protein YrrD